MALPCDQVVLPSLKKLPDTSPGLVPIHARQLSRSGCQCRSQSRVRTKAREYVVVNAARSTTPLAASSTSTVEQEPPQEAGTVDVDDESVLQVTDDILCLRGTCTTRLKFEVQYGLKRGTSDNSYLIKGTSRESTVLIDVPFQAFAEKYVKTLKKTISLDSIGRIILTHFDPKCVSILQTVLEGCIKAEDQPPLELLLSKPALKLLRESFGADEKGKQILDALVFTVVSPNSKLELEGGRTLEFVRTATSRWPDMFCVYCPSEALLFSSKLFSAIVAPMLVTADRETPFDTDGWSMYGMDWKYYFDCLMAPVAKQISEALTKLDLVVTPAGPGQGLSRALKSLGSVLLLFGRYWKRKTDTPENVDMSKGRRVSTLCPRHGPVIRVAVRELLRCYNEWTEDQTLAKTKVMVMYASAYGNTLALAQAVSRGITKAGVGVDTLNLEMAEPEEISEVISKADGFTIGSPTLGGHMPTQVQAALGTIMRDSRAKQLPCGVFGSFGWSGEAVDEMEQKLSDGGFSFAFDSIRVKFKPTMKDLQACEESGTDLAQAVQKKLRSRTKSTALSFKSRGSSETAQAMGRVLGSMCVLTVKDQDAQTAMLASWITQASFDPPGITVAIKKDRALENFLVDGNLFVINILAEGRERRPAKQLLKPFKPGEDRFEGIETEVNEKTGCVVLPDAAAILECTVASRMETGDHWVVYAIVDGGRVLDAQAQSAVHHRKSGNSY